jgi:hypothetical protein
MILGLFTWDDTDDYSIHENYNHEVDVEISQWNDAANSDAQFLVQPPGLPHMHRFYSGPGGVKNTFEQNNVYGFDWNPGEITRFSPAGGGQSFVYNVAMALGSKQIDYVQCMPANLEIRINLWHRFGNSKPPELEDHHVVEVVIDEFDFVTGEKEFIPDGGTCTKHCQCNYPNSRCSNNKCAAV